jgi:GcrA cell cycle regulator
MQLRIGLSDLGGRTVQKKPMKWDENEIRILTQMWNNGYSSSIIANDLGCTRNAVIGKAHRLGLPSRDTTVRDEYKKRKRIQRKRKEALAPAPVIPVSLSHEPLDIRPVVNVEEKRAGVSLLDLKENMCRWPIGDPREDDFHFCGCPIKPENGRKPYCEKHAKIAYTYVPKRRS